MSEAGPGEASRSAGPRGGVRCVGSASAARCSRRGSGSLRDLGVAVLAPARHVRAAPTHAGRFRRAVADSRRRGDRLVREVAATNGRGVDSHSLVPCMSPPQKGEVMFNRSGTRSVAPPTMSRSCRYRSVSDWLRRHCPGRGGCGRLHDVNHDKPIRQPVRRRAVRRQRLLQPAHPGGGHGPSPTSARSAGRSARRATPRPSPPAFTPRPTPRWRSTRTRPSR